MELLENKYIKLRAVEPEDLDILYKWENDTRLWLHGNSLNPYSKQTLRQYIADTQSQDIYQSKQLRLMVDMKAENKTIGTVDLYDLDVRNMRAGIGILIDENYRENDFAYQSLEIVKTYAFSFLRLHQLYAHILVNNKASIGLFEKSGFVNNGTLKHWICTENSYTDAYIYQIINNNR